jgi:tellurite resistance protein TerC
MTIWLWVGFLLFVFFMLAVDLGVLHREAREVSIKEAFAWTGVCVFFALAFNVVVYFIYEYDVLGMGLDGGQNLTGAQAALQFFTGYLIEESLSLDNIFAIALVFAYFEVPLKYQHRVLFWGILGALVLRATMILAGTALIQKFEWMDYIFGGFLLLTSAKMLFGDEEKIEPEHNPLVRIAHKFYPVTRGFVGDRFFVRQDGKRAITPLFLTLILVESMDVMFAIDSIPAIFAITRDPFIVFTSNIFAILGLRSLYFVLADLIRRFHYLHMCLVILLAFIGMKMVLARHFPISIGVSLGIIVAILAVGVAASVLLPARREEEKP